MSASSETSNAFIMDSGAFLDVIPIILSYLDVKSLINLAKTCRFWKSRIYNDVYIWPKVIELPYIGHIHSHYYRHSTDDIIKAKLWSMLLPPENPKALEQILQNMALSDESIYRFALVEKVLFKNFVHTDESLRLTALLFPSIQEISFEGDLFTLTGVQYIAESCRKLKHIEFYCSMKLDVSQACGFFNTDDHKESLERLFIHRVDRYRRYADRKPVTNDVLPFMVLCKRCGLYFNDFKNQQQMLCLHHPGEYWGYGHSCSSFSCCGSNTPRYASTMGCQYTHHLKTDDTYQFSYRAEELHDGHPEYMFQVFKPELFQLSFTERRDLRGAYQVWKLDIKPEETE